MKTKIENNIEYIMRDLIWYPNLRMREEYIPTWKVCDGEASLLAYQLLA